jgi:hypothetical protein
VTRVLIFWQEVHQDGVYLEDAGGSSLPINWKTASSVAAKQASKNHNTGQVLKCFRLYNNTVFTLCVGFEDGGKPRYDHLVCQGLNEAAGVLAETAHMQRNPCVHKHV